MLVEITDKAKADELAKAGLLLWREGMQPPYNYHKYDLGEHSALPSAYKYIHFFICLEE